MIPVRVFQQFTELDLISGGRAEIMAGRGSFVESFPLFGYDLDDYDDLYAEKLELLLALRSVMQPVNWSGRLRAPLREHDRLPPPAPGPAAGVGRGRRLARFGHPRRLARPAADARDHRRPARTVRARWSSSTGAPPSDAGPRRRALAAAGDQHPRVRRRDLAGRRQGLRRPVSGDDEQESVASAAGPRRAAAEYDALRSPRGAVAAGSPERVAEKILFEHGALRTTRRYVGQMSVGAVAHGDVMRSIELFGTEGRARSCATRSPAARRAASVDDVPAMAPVSA